MNVVKHLGLPLVLAVVGRSFMGFVSAHKKTSETDTEGFEGVGALNRHSSS